jgi:hypothetical protein
MDGRSNVGAQGFPVNANDRVSLGGKDEVAQGGPQQRTRRHEATRDVRTGDSERVPDQDRGPVPESTFPPLSAR